MNKSETITKLADALAKFQADVKNPANTATNPYYKSKYAPLGDVLNTVRPVLGKYGLSFVQNQVTDENGKLGVTTMLMHSSGEYVETDPIFAAPEKNTPQGLGSVSTYLRRYQLSSVLGIASEDDDDGNSNENTPPNKAKPTKNTTPTNDNTETPTVADDGLTKAIETIEALATSLQESNVDKKLIAEAIKKHNIIGGKGVANYNKITDIDVARNVYKELKALEV
jgi:hypothetical protein